MNERVIDRNICFVGAGSMAEALIKGLTAKRIIAPDKISVLNKSAHDRLSLLSELYEIAKPAGPQDREILVSQADWIVLAMKPKDALTALHELRRLVRPEQLIISVVAGLPMAAITDTLGIALPVVRTMPNTSCIVGLSATGLCFNEYCKEEEVGAVSEMFCAIGEISIVDESEIDIVTGLSGSGPAYVYYLMEAMEKAGRSAGLTPETARRLTLQTVLGAAHMVKSSGADPGDLRRKVMSPDGTTEAAIQKLSEFGFTEAMGQAIRKASERSRELGESFKSTRTLDH